MFSRIIANEAIRFSILTLSRMLHKHYGEQMVVSNKESGDGYCDIMVQVANYFIIIATT